MSAPNIWSLLRKRDVDGLSTLLASGSIDVNEAGAGEQSQLHLACELDATDGVSALLAAGAD
jgi:hypothetical protein